MSKFILVVHNSIAICHFNNDYGETNHFVGGTTTNDLEYVLGSEATPSAATYGIRLLCQSHFIADIDEIEISKCRYQLDKRSFKRILNSFMDDGHILLPLPLVERFQLLNYHESKQCNRIKLTGGTA